MAEIGEDPILAGFIADGHLVVSTNTRILALGPGYGEAAVVADDLDNVDNPLVHASSGMIYVRQGDALLQADSDTGEVTEVATELVPGRFDFTQPGVGWISFLTQDGYALLDASTGEIVSRVKPPANRTQGIEFFGTESFLASGSGDTVVVAEDPFIALNPQMTPGGSVWLLSPEYPDGLEIAGPSEDAASGGFRLSKDGATLYAWTSESMSGPDDLWATPLGTEPAWELLAEDVSVGTFVPIDGAP